MIQARGGQPKARWGLEALVLLAVLAGCASNPSQPQEAAPREIVTASDETEVAKRARIRLELAAAYFSQGQAATALDELKQALAINPNQALAYNLRGLIYADLNEDRLAEDSFLRAQQLDPRDANVVHNHGWFLCQRRRYAEALVKFDQAVDMPRYADVTKTLLAKGVCLARSGNPAEAEKVLAHSYELDPSNPATAMNLSMLLYQRGEYERARFYVRRVNGVPELLNAETLWLAARIENKLGNRSGALDLGDQLRRRFPQSREAAAFDRGRFDE